VLCIREVEFRIHRLELFHLEVTMNGLRVRSFENLEAGMIA